MEPTSGQSRTDPARKAVSASAPMPAPVPLYSPTPAPREPGEIPRQRWFRWDQGGPRPKIMGRRWRHLRRAHRASLNFFRFLAFLPPARPRYTVPRLTAERRQAERDAAAEFLGSRSTHPAVTACCSEQARRGLLASPRVADGYKQQLRDQGPGCTAAQEAEVLAIIGGNDLRSAAKPPPPKLAEHGFAVPPHT